MTPSACQALALSGQSHAIAAAASFRLRPSFPLQQSLQGLAPRRRQLGYRGRGRRVSAVSQRGADPFPPGWSFPPSAHHRTPHASFSNFRRPQSYKLGLRDNLTDVIEQLAWQFDSRQYTTNGEYQVGPCLRSSRHRPRPTRPPVFFSRPSLRFLRRLFPPSCLLRRTTLAALATATLCPTTPFRASTF